VISGFGWIGHDARYDSKNSGKPNNPNPSGSLQVS